MPDRESRFDELIAWLKSGDGEAPVGGFISQVFHNSDTRHTTVYHRNPKYRDDHGYTITKRRTTKGIAFDLYFRWKGQRYRPLLGYDLSPISFTVCHRPHSTKFKTKNRETAFADHPPRCPPAVLAGLRSEKRIDRGRDQKEFWRITSCPAMPASETTSPAVIVWTPATCPSNRKDGLPICEARLDEGATAGTVRRMAGPQSDSQCGRALRETGQKPVKHVELPDAEKRTRIAEPGRTWLSSARCGRMAHQARMPAELWRIIQVAVSVGLREGKFLEIERSWMKKREWVLAMCLPPAASRIKGTPARSAVEPHPMPALGAEIFLPMAGSFAVGLISGHLKNIG